MLGDAADQPRHLRRRPPSPRRRPPAAAADAEAAGRAPRSAEVARGRHGDPARRGRAEVAARRSRSSRPSTAPTPAASAGHRRAQRRAARWPRPSAGPADARRRPTPARLVAEARAALDGWRSYQVAHAPPGAGQRHAPARGGRGPRHPPRAQGRPPDLAERPEQGARGPLPGRRAGRPDARQHGRLRLPIPRLSIPPDSPMVMRNSRHPITEAGFDSIVAGWRTPSKSAGGSGLAYAGLETADGLDRPHHCLVRTDARRARSGGSTSTPQTHLPALVEAIDARRRPARTLRLPRRPARPAELAAAEAFDPTPAGASPGASSAGSPGATPTPTADPTPR